MARGAFITFGFRSSLYRLAAWEKAGVVGAALGLGRLVSRDRIRAWDWLAMFRL